MWLYQWSEKAMLELKQQRFYTTEMQVKYTVMEGAEGECLVVETFFLHSK